jgi:hypothetical protein
MLYVEYFSRLPGVPLERFHEVAGAAGRWSEEYEDDELLLNLGRTFRVGPEPEYLAVWFSRGKGFERIGAWERAFASGEASRFEDPFKEVARIDRAGCYEPLLDPVPGHDGLYYVERYAPVSGAERDAVRASFEDRRDRHGGAELTLLCERIGYLGPDPAGLAVWNVTSWDRLDPIVRDLGSSSTVVELVDAGLYRDLGQETL